MNKIVLIIAGVIIAVFVGAMIVMQLNYQQAMTMLENERNRAIAKQDSEIRGLKDANETLNRKYEEEADRHGTLVRKYEEQIKKYDETIALLKEMNDNLALQYEKEIARLKAAALNKPVDAAALKKYEDEINSLKASNDDLIRQHEAETRKLKEDLDRQASINEKANQDKEKSAAQDNNLAVLAAIRKLQSVTDVYTNKVPDDLDPTVFRVRNSMMSYRDYSTKVADVKTDLVQSIEDSKDTLPDEAKNLVNKAMDCYQDALVIWDLDFDRPTRERMRNPPREEINKNGRTDRKDGVKDEPRQLTPAEEWAEKKEKIDTSKFYIDKYFFLNGTPYSRMVPEGHILLPRRAVVGLWQEASKYVNDAGKILNPDTK